MKNGADTENPDPPHPPQLYRFALLRSNESYWVAFVRVVLGRIPTSRTWYIRVVLDPSSLYGMKILANIDIDGDLHHVDPVAVVFASNVVYMYFFS